MAEQGTNIDPVSLASAGALPGFAGQSKGHSQIALTLDDLEREVYIMEDQLNKILGMISRLKRMKTK